MEDFVEKTGRLSASRCAVAAAWFVALASLRVSALTVTLAWDANPEPDVAGYRLYYWISPGGLTNTINVDNVTTFAVSPLVPGKTYSFYVTCYNESGLESDPSNLVEYTAPPTNSPPVAQAGQGYVRRESVSGNTVTYLPLNFSLSGADSDGDALIYTIVRYPHVGGLAGFPPDLIYNADPSFPGEDEILFKVSDGSATSATVAFRFRDPAMVSNFPPLAGQRAVDGNGSPSLRLSGDVVWGMQVELQSSVDLIQWIPVIRVPSGTPLLYIDLGMPDTPQRFYRSIFSYDGS